MSLQFSERTEYKTKLIYLICSTTSRLAIAHKSACTAVNGTKKFAWHFWHNIAVRGNAKVSLRNCCVHKVHNSHKGRKNCKTAVIQWFDPFGSHLAITLHLWFCVNTMYYQGGKSVLKISVDRVSGSQLSTQKFCGFFLHQSLRLLWTLWTLHLLWILWEPTVLQ